MKNIILYTQKGCPKCEALRDELNEKGFNYTIETDVKKMISLGIKETPMLSVDGALKNFSEAMAWAYAKETDNEKQ